jgi:hypothetical protein
MNIDFDVVIGASLILSGLFIILFVFGHFATRQLRKTRDMMKLRREVMSAYETPKKPATKMWAMLEKY